MELKTRFNIGDDVWMIHPYNANVCTEKITSIKIKVLGIEEKKPGKKKDLIKTGMIKPNLPQIEYGFHNAEGDISLVFSTMLKSFNKNQSEVFATKKELVNSL